MWFLVAVGRGARRLIHVGHRPGYNRGEIWLFDIVGPRNIPARNGGRSHDRP